MRLHLLQSIRPQLSICPAGRSEWCLTTRGALATPKFSVERDHRESFITFGVSPPSCCCFSRPTPITVPQRGGGPFFPDLRCKQAESSRFEKILFLALPRCDGDGKGGGRGGKVIDAYLTISRTSSFPVCLVRVFIMVFGQKGGGKHSVRL